MGLLADWIGDVGGLIQESLDQQKRDDLFDILCQACGGLGYEKVDERGNWWWRHTKTCRACGGRGYVG